MLPGLSNVPAPDTTIESSGITFLADIAIASCVYKDMEISKAQGCQTQHMSNDTVADCSSNTKNKKISDFSIKTANASETGIANAEKKPYQCNQCGRVFQSSRNLKKHTKNVHKTGGREKCPSCEKTFKNKRCLGVHRRNKHNNKTRKHKCEQCNRVFESTAKLTQHKNIVHVTTPPVKCPDCEKVFKLERALGEHRKNEHSDSEKPYKCNYCGKTFIYPSRLKVHEITHTDERNYICPVCNKRYHNISGLNRHIMIHNGNREKRFTCTECGSAFLYTSLLERHKLTHSKDKHFECQICNKKLSSQPSLSRHHKIFHGRDY